MNLGKILFMEKLDVIKKIFWLDSNIFIVIIFLIVIMFITYKA